MLLGYCRRILPPERAEDAVQVTFMRAYERLGQFHDEAAFRAWLYRVAHNVAIDGLRDRGFGHCPIDETVEGIDRPDMMAERHERMRDVVVAIQDLPDNQRDAMVLSAFEGRSYDEISGTLGVTLGATRQLLARARVTLRRAAAAVLPLGLLHRPVAAPGERAVAGWRFAELAGSAGAGASTVMAQVGAGAVLTAGALGGLAAATGPGPSAASPPLRAAPGRQSRRPRPARPPRRPQGRYRSRPRCPPRPRRARSHHRPIRLPPRPHPQQRRRTHPRPRRRRSPSARPHRRPRPPPRFRSRMGSKGMSGARCRTFPRWRSQRPCPTSKAFRSHRRLTQ